MGEAARSEDNVVEFVDHLRNTLNKFDVAIAELQEKRRELALSLAAIEAATDPAVLAAAADYEERIATQRPYETAEPAKDVLTEAYRRFGQ